MPYKTSEARRAYIKKWYANRPGYRRQYRDKRGPGRHRKIVPTRPEPALCECCGGPPNGNRPKERARTLCLDHDHATGEFRGWLCNRCNLLLGHVKDSREYLQKLIAYLSPSQEGRISGCPGSDKPVSADRTNPGSGSVALPFEATPRGRDPTPFTTRSLI